MRLILIVILGVLIFTFGWGWVMEVHYGNMTTDSYTHRYLLDIKGIYDGFVETTRGQFNLFFNPNQPLVRREFALPTV